MRDVAIVGIGMTPVGEHWGSTLQELALEASQKAIQDAGNRTAIDAVYVGNAFAPTIGSQSHLGAFVSDYLGLHGVETFAVEAGEASGGVALRTGYLAVASGLVESVLVIGAEKSTDSIGSSQTQARTVSLNADFEAVNGVTLSALAGMLMRRYMYEYDVPLDAFENFTINAHANGKHNSNAMFRNTVREGAFLKAPMVAEPLNLFDGAPDADGAAAVLLTSAEKAPDLVPKPIYIRGSAVANDRFMLQDREDLLHFEAVQTSFTKALNQAQLEQSDIDLFELHDAYTIFSTLTLEATQFAKRGEGWKLAQDNEIQPGGKLPISTFGGLKSRGNPIGATGIYQAVEACLQLRGEAGGNQVANAKTALIQNLGGVASTAVTHILQNTIR